MTFSRHLRQRRTFLPDADDDIILELAFAGGQPRSTCEDLDSAIDSLVNELYDLTDNEIEIFEVNVQRRR